MLEKQAEISVWRKEDMSHVERQISEPSSG